MERIGKHNYEAFLLDHMEGNLDAAGTEALFAFFEQYPELKPEFLDDIESISLEPEHISFKEKNELKHIEEEQEENEWESAFVLHSRVVFLPSHFSFFSSFSSFVCSVLRFVPSMR